MTRKTRARGSKQRAWRASGCMAAAERPLEPSPDQCPRKGKQELLRKAEDSLITADPPRDDAFMINTHDNLRPKCCYNTNCPWKLTCSKAAEFSFDRPGSRVRTWLGMTGDIHASKISENGWHDFAHCKKAVETLDSCLFVRKAERTAGVAFLRASFQTSISFAGPQKAWMDVFFLHDVLLVMSLTKHKSHTVNDGRLHFLISKQCSSLNFKIFSGFDSTEHFASYFVLTRQVPGIATFWCKPLAEMLEVCQGKQEAFLLLLSTANTCFKCIL